MEITGNSVADAILSVYAANDAGACHAVTAPDSATNPDPARHGACESQAALGCTRIGSLRVLPESLAPGGEPESILQCMPCYNYSALRLTATMASLAELDGQVTR